jgi:hypothetical protein
MAGYGGNERGDAATGMAEDARWATVNSGRPQTSAGRTRSGVSVPDTESLPQDGSRVVAGVAAGKVFGNTG